jgi:site-specific recombinase XerD
MPRKTYKNIFVTEELIKQINPINTNLVELFLKEKASRASKTTINKYLSDSHIYFVWNLLYNNNVSFIDTKKLDLANFFAFAVDSLHWGSARSNGLRSFLSSLSVFIEKFFDSDYPEFRNIILKTIESSPREFRRDKTILTEKQVTDLLEHLSKTDSQKACFVALAACSGSRFSELLRFSLDILDENHTAFGDLFIETLKSIKTKGRGRSGKLLYKYILKDKFLPYYHQWLKDREEIMKKNGKTHLALFIQKNGDEATEGTARSWVTTIENYLGFPFYMHCLRHYLCTELSRKNIPAALVKDLFGWESTLMVDVYSDLTSKDREWKELENLR